MTSYQHPLASPLDKLIQHHGHIREHEAANVEPEELGGVAGRQLKTDVRGRRVLEAGVFDLAGDLVCEALVPFKEVREEGHTKNLSRVE